jgi:hypothetical protein
VGPNRRCQDNITSFQGLLDSLCNAPYIVSSQLFFGKVDPRAPQGAGEKAALVSMISPSSISVPMMIISAKAYSLLKV